MDNSIFVCNGNIPKVTLNGEYHDDDHNYDD